MFTAVTAAIFVLSLVGYDVTSPSNDLRFGEPGIVFALSTAV
jgi:hypothetical protein